MIKYTLKQVKPNIFLLSFEKQYDLAMTFLRYQEFYESPSPKFRNKTWELVDFMEWYSAEYGDGAFTYPKDWSGFNIPSRIIEKVLGEGAGIPDYNKYDELMAGVFDKLYNNEKIRNFYLIGIFGDGKNVIEHEIAHGLFYTNAEYREEMKKLVRSLPEKIRTKIFNVLKEKGYTSNVHIDECQAYLSTGTLDQFGEISKHCKVFENAFNRFNA